MGNIFQKNLAKTVKRFGLKNRWISTQSESDESGLSKYLGMKRDVYTDTLSRWFEVLPAEAQKYFLEECLQKKLEMRQKSIIELIDDLDWNSPKDRSIAAMACIRIGERQMEYEKLSKITEGKEI